MRLVQILVSAVIAALATASRLPSYTRGVYLLLADSDASV